MSADRSRTLPIGYELSNEETIKSLKPSFVTLAEVLKDCKQIVTNSDMLKSQLLAIDPTCSLLLETKTDDPTVECGNGQEDGSAGVQQD